MVAEMDVVAEADQRRLERMIDAATNSPAKELDSARIKSIKNLVRFSDSNVHAAVRLLMDRMNKNHSQVRFLALLIVNELFTRSKLFRTLWVQNFPKFLILSVGFRKEHPLPPPSDRASLLRNKSLEFLQNWNEKFGQFYKQLRLGYHYLKNTLRLPFPDLNVAREADQQRLQRAARTQELLRNKFETLRQNFDSYKSEIQSTVDEIGECFEILNGDKRQDDADDEVEIEEYERVTSLSLRKIREEALNEGETLVESSDNQAVFDVVRELYKLLTARHMPGVQEWLFVLTRVDLPDSRASESMLKKVIDLRNVLQAAKDKCERLGSKLTSDVEDEVIWEEGVIASADHNSSGKQASASLSNDKAQVSQVSQVDRAPASDAKAKSIQGESSSLKKKLAKEAPVLPWGSYLDVWGSNSAIPTNQRGLEIENHWGRVDMDAVIPPERASEFNVRATYYKEQQPEIQPCRAPLRKGGLCQRQDLRVCPLHGPIRPRDSEGNLIDEKPNSLGAQDASQIRRHSVKRKGAALASQTEDVDRLSTQLKSGISEEQTVRLIAGQALDNVRSKDEKMKKQKQADRNSAKRAKLAKVREHNDSVLRDSAIASTSQGLGEAIAEDLEGWTGNQNKHKRQKQTLSSLLKKKPTTKDRLAQKLLNARVSESTVRQLTNDEVANYKESFANQW